ncbi:MAG: PilZ domain-containing protein [Candidatus Acidiferrales bacterium]
MPNPTGIWLSDKRREPRHSFTATVELLDTSVQVRIRAKTGNLSMNGCYVNTVNPFPVGSRVKVTITHGEASFTALGTVAHGELNMGMGISFIKVEPNQKEILLKWLVASSGS